MFSTFIEFSNTLTREFLIFSYVGNAKSDDWDAKLLGSHPCDPPRRLPNADQLRFCNGIEHTFASQHPERWQSCQRGILFPGWRPKRKPALVPSSSRFCPSCVFSRLFLSMIFMLTTFDSLTNMPLMASSPAPHPPLTTSPRRPSRAPRSMLRSKPCRVWQMRLLKQRQQHIRLGTRTLSFATR